jgi:putative nucleotidyltransferase with HDIG domain
VDEKKVRVFLDESTGSLLPIPHIALKVLNLTEDPDCTVMDLVKEISKDQGMTTGILQLVNSAFYGFLRKISNIRLGVTIIGLSKIRALVLGHTAAHIFLNADTGTIPFHENLWEHTVTTAVGAQLLAKLIRSEAREEAFTAGLLHDIGKLILEKRLTDGNQQVIDEMTLGGEIGLAAEKTLFDITHHEVGAYIANQWNLPASLVEIIEHHHELQNMCDNPSEKSMLLIMVGLSNLLAHKDNYAGELRKKDSWSRRLWNLLGFDEDAVDPFVESYKREKEELLATFRTIFH